MVDDRTNARVVGALFILATAAAIIGGTLVLPIEDADTVAAVLADQSQVVAGIAIELVLVLGVVGIATMLYPILRRVDAGLALSYVGIRVLEAVLLMTATTSALVFVELARATSSTDLDPVAETLVVARAAIYDLGGLVVFGVSAVLLNSLLGWGRLVPAWLWRWGLIGGALLVVRGIGQLFGTDFPAIWQALLAGPIAVNEMALAIWLIVRGYHPTSTPAPNPTPASDTSPVAASTAA